MQAILPSGIRTLLACTFFYASSTAFAFAESFPAKPIRVIIPLSAGSIADVALRQMATFMQERFNQTWVIENRPGGNMIPGLNACAKSASDGYTLCFVASAGLVFAPHMMTQIPYDGVKEFKAVSNVFYVIEALGVRGQVPATSVQELKAIAVANPGKFNFGTLGSAATNELYRRWLSDEWKTEFAAIPYKGGGEIAVALLQGQIDISRIGIGNLAPHLTSGKIKVLAQSVRSPILPTLPTLEDVGLGGYAGGRAWWGLAAPAGTPDPIVQTINQSVAAALNDPKFHQFLVESYLDPAPGPAQEFADLIKTDFERVGQTIRKYNLSLK